MEGVLSRKHEWESVDRKSSNRSWDKVYVVISQANKLEFYKDQKHFKNNKFIESVSLTNGVAEAAVDYTKKEHVLRVKLNNGGQYLFRAKDAAEMSLWISKVQASVASGAAPDSAKTKSLPPPEKQQRSSSSLSGPGGPSASLKPQKR
jgi:spectrin beta